MTDPDFIAPARPVIGEDEIEAAVRVLRSGMVVQGPEVAAFEEEFSALVEGRHCVAVNSGTSALHLSLMALGVKPGDEVIVPSFSFAATANAVRLVGADPVFVDIEPDHFCVDPAAVEAAIGPKTVAIMPVHLYGHPADMTALTAIAERHQLAIVEDAAQAHAATWQGTPVGAFGAAGCFSFYPTKNMHSLEGGMITTGDATFARNLRLLRNQGMEQRYANEVVGANMRLTDVAAAIGRVQLGKLEGWTEVRRANAAKMTQALGGVSTGSTTGGLTGVSTGSTTGGLGGVSTGSTTGGSTTGGSTTGGGVVPPPEAAGARHVYHQYTVRVPEGVAGGRDALQAALKDAGVGSAVYYPTPIHELAPFRPGYTDLAGQQPANRDWDLPVTMQAAREVLSLPVFPGLTDADLDRIVGAITTAVAG